MLLEWANFKKNLEDFLHSHTASISHFPALLKQTKLKTGLTSVALNVLNQIRKIPKLAPLETFRLPHSDPGVVKRTCKSLVDLCIISTCWNKARRQRKCLKVAKDHFTSAKPGALCTDLRDLFDKTLHWDSLLSCASSDSDSLCIAIFA